MKRLFYFILFLIALTLLVSIDADCQTFIKDSSKILPYPMNNMMMVDIEPIKFNIFDDSECKGFMIEYIKDYGIQPLGNGKYTGSAVVSYWFNRINLEMSINDIDYDYFKMYGWKYVFWLLANKYSLKIK